MHELLPDLTPFSVLLYPIDFNNMKAAVKCTVTNAEPHNVFMSGRHRGAGKNAAGGQRK